MRPTMTPVTPPLRRSSERSRTSVTTPSSRPSAPASRSAYGPDERFGQRQQLGGARPGLWGAVHAPTPVRHRVAVDAVAEGLPALARHGDAARGALRVRDARLDDRRPVDHEHPTPVEAADLDSGARAGPHARPNLELHAGQRVDAPGLPHHREPRGDRAPRRARRVAVVSGEQHADAVAREVQHVAAVVEAGVDQRREHVRHHA